MLIYTDLEYKILELIRQYNITSTLSDRLTFGGGSGPGGGSGGPITTPIGQLPQTYICYDTSELATTYVPGSGESLLDNLNRIRSGYVIVPSGYVPINFTVAGDGNLFDYLEGIDDALLTGSGHVIEDDTTAFPHQDFLQFLDAGSCTVTIADDDPRTIVTISGTDAGHVIRDSDEDFTPRTGLQFLGDVTVTDDAGDDETVITISGTGGHQIRDIDSTFTPRSGLQFIGDVVVTDDAGDDETVVEITTSGIAMSTYIGVTPAPDGVETEFTVTTGEYIVGTLIVSVNGQIQTKGSDFSETVPSGGTFTFLAGSIPQTDDIIRTFFGLPGTGIGGTGTSGVIPKWVSTSELGDSIISDDGSKISLPAGTDINEFSTDGTLVGDSDDAVPTEKAVKIYVDTQIPAGSGHVIEDSTTAFPHQDFLQFLGDITVTDDDPRTIVTASGVDSTLVVKGDIPVRDVTTTTRLGVGTNDQVLTADSAQSLGIKWANAGGSDYIHIRDEKAQNTGGGTFTSGAWRTRDLNTEVSDDGEHASLASNQITLAAGTYVIQTSAPAYHVDVHQAVLWNTADAPGTFTLIGTCAYAEAADYTSQTRAFISGQFTIAAPATFEIQHRGTVTKATNGFGNPCNFTTEVYTVVELWKTA